MSLRTQVQVPAQPQPSQGTRVLGRGSASQSASNTQDYKNVYVRNADRACIQPLAPTTPGARCPRNATMGLQRVRLPSHLPLCPPLAMCLLPCVCGDSASSPGDTGLGPPLPRPQGVQQGGCWGRGDPLSPLLTRLTGAQGAGATGWTPTHKAPMPSHPVCPLSSFPAEHCPAQASLHLLV